MLNTEQEVQVRKKFENDGQQRPTMRVSEAADILEIGLNQAYQAVKRGEIPSIRIGKRIIIPTGAFYRKLNDGAA